MALVSQTPSDIVRRNIETIRTPMRLKWLGLWKRPSSTLLLLFWVYFLHCVVRLQKLVGCSWGNARLEAALAAVTTG